VRDQEIKMEEVKVSHTLEMGMGYPSLRKEKWILRDEKFVSGWGERVRVIYRSVIDVVFGP